MRALILTNQFYHFAGAEMCALEIAEELRRRNFDVSLIANEIDGELRTRLAEIGVNTSTELDKANLFEFDLVWSQHHMLPSLLLQAVEMCVEPDSWPFIVFNHLSPYDPAEVPGPFIERQFADIILANSPETAEKLKEYGAPFDEAEVFANPAPLGYGQVRSTPKQHLQSLLVVSNHRNPIVSQSLRKISNCGIKITRVGRRHSSQRVTPELIESHDAVLTIGKTVQYALRCNRPVFCYDRFAGPGWLTGENFTEAAWFNFSGRDRPKTRSAEELAAEIINGYAAGRDFVASLDASRLRPYCLEGRLDDVLTLLQSTREKASWHRSRIDSFCEGSTRVMIRHEAQLAALYRKEFLHRRSLEKRKQNLRRPLHILQKLLRLH